MWIKDPDPYPVFSRICLTQKDRIRIRNTAVNCRKVNAISTYLVVKCFKKKCTNSFVSTDLLFTSMCHVRLHIYEYWREKLVCFRLNACVVSAQDKNNWFFILSAYWFNRFLFTVVRIFLTIFTIQNCPLTVSQINHFNWNFYDFIVQMDHKLVHNYILLCCSRFKRARDALRKFRTPPKGNFWRFSGGIGVYLVLYGPPPVLLSCIWIFH